MSNQTAAASPPSRSPRAGSGFTMVEMLVVMFVITMLLAIGVPAALRFKTQAKINACQVTVNIIDKAVEMYHGLHKNYPTTEEMVGKLIGQSFKFEVEANEPTEIEDYHPGPGYRLQPRGTVYGPWNDVDKLARSGDHVQDAQSDQVHFIDAFGHYIWYCPFDTENLTYTDEKFDKEDSEDGVTINSIADYAKDASNRFYRRDYIIMSQSANGKWGLFRDIGGTSGSSALPTDDVTNFIK
ncbi:MAG: prepilin-type N-terminal cleavage/methylation domain-containing protein [Phycisphaerae bacterium]|nr:prepilin-type N-terminal cleavage/methylation domain-containing protein [Planctomycetota bacterium]MBL7221008.1 prepilin-type N-terminal cleavage/methylation domain-containing protein [Phycisphaerae bacterium]